MDEPNNLPPVRPPKKGGQVMTNKYGVGKVTRAGQETSSVTTQFGKKVEVPNKALTKFPNEFM
jgi:hypothetical protein